ncbi:hypothetical protein GCM10010435_71840 [Winogradskya consettensis]|uniref:Uncharacterized protein n=1 Tax=Winogradskya consettensis TaxID=113560 RepID=A0A919SV76_9ACTN|nr:hypothetical protein Aco04nite_56390 [Actinoplanes consettensis]
MVTPVTSGGAIGRIGAVQARFGRPHPRLTPGQAHATRACTSDATEACAPNAVTVATGKATANAAAAGNTSTYGNAIACANRVEKKSQEDEYWRECTTRSADSFASGRG